MWSRGLLAAATVAAAASFSGGAAPGGVLELRKAPRVGTTNVRYASWNIDSSYNRGFVHTAFTNPNLVAAAKSLAPSTVRFGGGGNDYLHYAAHRPCNSSHDGWLVSPHASAEEGVALLGPSVLLWCGAFFGRR